MELAFNHFFFVLLLNPNGVSSLYKFRTPNLHIILLKVKYAFKPSCPQGHYVQTFSVA